RDKQNTWQTELAEGRTPTVVNNTVISFPDSKDFKNVDVSFYDPWKNKWMQNKAEGNKVSLPDFSRSLVVKMKY
ncbi:MAG: cellulase family glycosylhydrolase, partial [Planctomycetota bacterium]